MSLPISRDATFAPGSQVPSETLNRIQDCIIDAHEKWPSNPDSLSLMTIAADGALGTTRDVAIDSVTATTIDADPGSITAASISGGVVTTGEIDIRHAPQPVIIPASTGWLSTGGANFGDYCVMNAMGTMRIPLVLIANKKITAVAVRGKKVGADNFTCHLKSLADESVVNHGTWASSGGSSGWVTASLDLSSTPVVIGAIANAHYYIEVLSINADLMTNIVVWVDYP